MYTVRTEHCNYSLMDYITGHLEGNDHDEIEAHLRECADCQKIYHDLLHVDTECRQSLLSAPDPLYFTNILPRIRERIETKQNTTWEYGDISTRIVLPLAVSFMLIIFIITLPINVSFELPPSDILNRAVKDFSTEEVVHAINAEYTHASVMQYQDIAALSIVEHLSDDHFVVGAVVKQLDNEEIGDIVVEGMISDLNGEQVEQLLSGLSERMIL